MTTNNTDDELISRLKGKDVINSKPDNLGFGITKFFVPPLAIEAAKRIEELQGRLDCIKELLDLAYEENCMNLYTPQGVNQAHRIAAGGELPKRVKE